MGWLIFSVFVTICLFVGLGFKTETITRERLRYGQTTTEEVIKVVWRLRKKQFFSVLGLALILFGLYTKVPANSVGIVYSPFGGTKETTLSEGYNGKGLLDQVYEISTEIQTTTVEDLTTQTRDAQFLWTDLDIKYQVSVDNAYLIFKQYRTLENMKDTMVIPTTQRVLEKITTKYDVFEALGEGKSQIYAEFEQALSEEFAQYGVQFSSVTLLDMDAGTEIEAAIEAEGVAKKAVDTAKYELEQAEISAKQKSVDAKADQDAAVIKAETKLIEAQAEKEANDLLKQSLSEEILRQLWIEKWNGKVPTYYGGEGTDLIFNAGGTGATE